MQNMKKNEKAVSPVLGVILMVAITVIVAAVVAAFVFGIGAPSKAPQASLGAKVSASTSGSTITLEHQGGESLVLKSTRVTINPNAFDPASKTDDLGAIVKSDGSSIWSINGAAITTEVTLNPGDVATSGQVATASTLTAGNTAEVKVIDITTGKLILDEKVIVTA